MKQLTCLLAVEREGHFRRAAEQCGITQPSLSAQIQNLEHVVGLKLVERSRARVGLTPEGRQIALHAQRISDETQAIQDFSAGAQKGLVGTIRLGSKPTLGPYLMPHVVASLHKQHKTLKLYVRESEPRELEHELQRGIHDVILTQLPKASADHVAVELFQEPLYLALARDHPLAEKESLSVKALKGLDILSLNPAFHLHDQVHTLCHEFNANLVQDYEGTSLDALRQMVGMGMGATFLPALYVHSEISARSEVVVRKLTGRSIQRPIGLIWRKSMGRGASYKRLADVIRTVIQRKFKDMRPSV